MEWTPVSERMPDEDKKGLYLVTIDTTMSNGTRIKWVTTAIFDGTRFIDVWNVTAWMPLPEAYDGDTTL